jgi:hypothetical protein
MKTNMRWSSPNCDAAVSTPFCPTCGEHVLHTRELTLRPLIGQVFESFTNIDGRLLRSFNQAVAINARSLIIFMAVFFSLAPAIVFRRSGRPPVVHVVFALHFYAFVLLLLCIATAIPVISVRFGGAGLESESLDHAISIGLLMISAVYLFLSANAVYGDRGAVLVVKTVALTVAVAVVLLGYRFMLLLITLHST